MELNSAETELKVTELISMLTDIDEATPGAHAFMWIYFVGGASSSRTVHRAFFHDRLTQLYVLTGMRNVIETTNLLEYLWAASPTENWTRSSIVSQQKLIN